MIRKQDDVKAYMHIRMEKLYGVFDNDDPCGYVENKEFETLKEEFKRLLNACDHFYLYSYSDFFKCGHDFRKLYLTNNFKLNDLYEGIWLDCDTEINNGVLSKKEILPFNGTAYIKCFTEKYDDLAMWGMYGNNGYGICTEYDLKLLSNDDVLDNLFPVVYSNEPLAYIAWDMNSNPREYSNEKYSNKEYCWYYNKWDRWKEEKEWRIVLFADENNNPKEQSFECVSKVYCGPKFRSEEKICLQEVLKRAYPDRNIEVIDVLMKRDRYGIKVDAKSE